jgi:hypothetical protein
LQNIEAGRRAVRGAAQSAFDAGNGLFHAWRDNLPVGWWASPVSAFIAFGYIAALRVVFAAFA